MSRIEVNLWDAKRVYMDGDSLIVDTKEARYQLQLPMETALPKFLWEHGVCRHSGFMHGIDGGCNATGCDCLLTRNDEHRYEEDLEPNQRDEDESIYQQELDKQFNSYRQERQEYLF